MRSVPHRVVCLVGLDDGVFPRIGVVDGDDALARDPMTGERDIRSEDRQLLLDAIGAATEKLVITYTGANEHQRPARCRPRCRSSNCSTPSTSPPRSRSATRCSSEHPLQPFDIDNVTPGQARHARRAAVHVRPDDADRRAGGGRAPRPAARAARRSRCPPRRRSTSRSTSWSASSRIRSRASSARWTTRCRGTSTRSRTRCRSRSTRWQSGRSATGCSTTCCAGMTAADAATGRMAPRLVAAGAARLAQGAARSRPRSAALAAAAQQHRDRDPRRVDVDVPIGDRRGGSPAPCRGVRRPAGRRHVLEARRQAPAGGVDSPGGVDRSRTRTGLDRGVHRPGQARGNRGRRDCSAAPPAGSAAEVLRDLVAIYDAGRREPLPLPLKTSYAWAEAAAPQRRPEREAGWTWKSGKLPRRGPGPRARPGVGQARPVARCSAAAPGEELPGRTPGWARSRRGCGCRCCAPRGRRD